MKATWTGWHVVLAVLTVIGGTAPQIAAAFPSTAAIMQLVTQVDTMVVGAIGMFTQSLMQQGKPVNAAGFARLRLMAALSFAFLLATFAFAPRSQVPVAAQGCKSPQQAITGVFTVEQIVCVVDAMVSGQLTGTAATIAGDVGLACQIAPQLTTDLTTFIQDFQNLTPEQQGRWAAWAKAHRASPAPSTAPAASH